MQALLIVLALAVFGMGGFLFMVASSSYSRRCWGIWLLTSASAMDEIRAAKRGIEDERRRREDQMRQSYGIDSLYLFKEDKSKTVDTNRVTC